MFTVMSLHFLYSMSSACIKRQKKSPAMAGWRDEAPMGKHMTPLLEKNKNAGSKIDAAAVIVFVVAVVMGLAGLATASLILYGIARMFFRYAFDVELPNPF